MITRGTSRTYIEGVRGAGLQEEGTFQDDCAIDITDGEAPPSGVVPDQVVAHHVVRRLRDIRHTNNYTETRRCTVSRQSQKFCVVIMTFDKNSTANLRVDESPTFLSLSFALTLMMDVPMVELSSTVFSYLD